MLGWLPVKNKKILTGNIVVYFIWIYVWFCAVFYMMLINAIFLKNVLLVHLVTIPTIVETVQLNSVIRNTVYFWFE